MSYLLKVSWLIPAIPIAGAALIGLLLLSFSRTINRLTKPISFILITAIGLSTALSIILFLNGVSGLVYETDLLFASSTFHLNLYLDLFIEKSLSITSALIFVSMIFSYYLLDRKKGYVRFISLVSGFSGILFFDIMNGALSDLFI